MLKLRDLELFRLDNQDNKTVCMLLILDYRRPSVLDDFPILKEIEDEDPLSLSLVIYKNLLGEFPKVLQLMKNMKY